MKYFKVGPLEYWKVPDREMRNVLKQIPEGASIEFVDELPEHCLHVGKVGQITQYRVDAKARNREYQRQHRVKMIAAGYKQVTLWVPKGKVDFIKQIAEDL